MVNAMSSAMPQARESAINVRVFTGAARYGTSARRPSPRRAYAPAVPLRRLVKNLRTSTDDLHREQLAGRFDAGHHDTVSIASAPLRTRIRIAGEVARLRVVPRAGSPSLEVTVDDGTGRALVVFTGRRSIAGIDPGRGLLLEGTARSERNRLVLMNPGYTLLG